LLQKKTDEREKERKKRATTTTKKLLNIEVRKKLVEFFNISYFFFYGDYIIPELLREKSTKTVSQRFC
jgi:hypothetical protein